MALTTIFLIFQYLNRIAPLLSFPPSTSGRTALAELRASLLWPLSSTSSPYSEKARYGNAENPAHRHSRVTNSAKLNYTTRTSHSCPYNTAGRISKLLEQAYLSNPRPEPIILFSSGACVRSSVIIPTSLPIPCTAHISFF